MARIGESKCWNPRCSCTDATVNKTSGGALQLKCHKCGADVYGKPGTKIFRDLDAVTAKDPTDTLAAPAPAPVATTKPKPAPDAPKAARPAAAPAPASSGGFGLLLG